jgi:hypothetical protein
VQLNCGVNLSGLTCKKHFFAWCIASHISDLSDTTSDSDFLSDDYFFFNDVLFCDGGAEVELVPGSCRLWPDGGGGDFSERASKRGNPSFFSLDFFLDRSGFPLTSTGVELRLLML